MHVIEGGDHSFKIGKKHLQLKGSTQDEAEIEAVQAIAAFVRKCLWRNVTLILSSAVNVNIKTHNLLPISGLAVMFVSSM